MDTLIRHLWRCRLNQSFLPPFLKAQTSAIINVYCVSLFEFVYALIIAVISV